MKTKLVGNFASLDKCKSCAKMDLNVNILLINRFFEFIDFAKNLADLLSIRQNYSNRHKSILSTLGNIKAP